MEIIKKDETITITLAESPELTRFDELAKKSLENMAEMCKLAYIITGDDKEKRRLFIEHVQETTKLSRTTAVQMLNAGKLYNSDNRLESIPRTNVVELLPVADENGVIKTEFYEETNTDPVSLAKMSQAKIRGYVKMYTTEDEPTEDTDDEDTEGEDSNDSENKPKEEKPAILEQYISIMQGAIDCLESIDARYSDDMEKDDLSFLHDTLKALRGCVSND